MKDTKDVKDTKGFLSPALLYSCTRDKKNPKDPKDVKDLNDTKDASPAYRTYTAR